MFMWFHGSKYFKVYRANVYVVSWIDVIENRHVGSQSLLRPKDTLAEVTFPSHNAAAYIEHAQFLAMDYPNMLTAVAVRIYIYLSRSGPPALQKSINNRTHHVS